MLQLFILLVVIKLGSTFEDLLIALNGSPGSGR